LPDLVITDLSMPRLTGPQLIEQMRRMPATAHLPVILVSSDMPAEAAAQAAACGADLFLGKPVDMRRLEASVTELLAARHLSL
jgi:CheY-like chemotaxis protein